MSDTDNDRVITADELESKIKQGLDGDLEFVQAVDESDGCGAKFIITIVSNVFKGKPLLAQHRLVNKLIAEELKFIHALTLKTSVPVLPTA